jgi:hypothetical protein
MSSVEITDRAIHQPSTITYQPLACLLPLELGIVAQYNPLSHERSPYFARHALETPFNVMV